MIELSHKNLEVWKRSIELVKEVYSLTDKFPSDELYTLISQLRRAAISVSSNIAEGASRKTKTEKRRFFVISRSSLVEIDTQIEIPIEVGYINKDDIMKLSSLANGVFAMLSGLIKSNA